MKRYEKIGISLDHCAVRFNQQLDHWDILILVALDLRVPLWGHDKGTNWQGRNWKWHGDCMSIGNVEDCLLQSWSKFKYESYRFIPIIPVLTNQGHSGTISNRKTAGKQHLNSYMTRVAESFIQIPPSLSPPTKRMVLGVDSSISMSLMMLWWCSMTCAKFCVSTVVTARVWWAFRKWRVLWTTSGSVSKPCTPGEHQNSW